ncbi:hypothetical protein WDU94_013531, partial [Cyamophila willieti]
QSPEYAEKDPLHETRVEQFHKFVREFNRNYDSDSEIRYRFEAFKVNMNVHDYYVENERGTAEYGMTEFLDYGEQELSRYLGKCPRGEPNLSSQDEADLQEMAQVGDKILYGTDLSLKSAPTSVDWRKKGLIGPVLNQGYCSSSWAYGAITALETSYALKAGHFLRFSKQQLIDCDYHNYACCGGRPLAAYVYIYRCGGIELDKTYNGRTFLRRCHFNPKNVKAKIVGLALFTNSSTEANEKIMEQYVAEKGPVVVNLTPNALTTYKSGILRQADTKCVQNSDYLSHTVTLVGFGEEGGIKYWIGKNSWGKNWGEKGYFRIERGVNMCGVASYGVAPIMQPV